jgi:hypothetical protein
VLRGGITSPEKAPPMTELLVLSVSVGLYVVCAAFVRVCERI